MFVRRLAVAIGLIAGLVGSQGPEFAQQYRQRIGGALDELKRIVAAFDDEATREGLTPPQAIMRLERNSDPIASERGRDMAQTIDRAGRLQEQLDAMQSSGPLNCLFVMAKDFDPEIAERTLDGYEPAAPLSLEALTAAGLAAIWGWAATHLFAWPIRRLGGRRGPLEGKAAVR